MIDIILLMKIFKLFVKVLEVDVGLFVLFKFLLGIVLLRKDGD